MAGKDDDCKQSAACAGEGKCKAVGGVCVKPSPADGSADGVKHDGVKKDGGKTDTKIDVKPDTTIDTKPDSKTDTKLDSKTDAKADTVGFDLNLDALPGDALPDVHVDVLRDAPFDRPLDIAHTDLVADVRTDAPADKSTSN